MTQRPTRRYAAETTVSSEKTRAEIERTLARYGATGFLYGWLADAATVMFEMHGRQIRFVIPLPDRDAYEFRYHPSGRSRGEASRTEAYEQALRQRWRALLLVLKAKLEAIEGGIATFEQEMLAYTILPGGQTVGERLGPHLDEALRTGRLPSLVPGLAAPESGKVIALPPPTGTDEGK